jgi:hypothetical protein
MMDGSLLMIRVLAECRWKPDKSLLMHPILASKSLVPHTAGKSQATMGSWGKEPIMP